MKINLMIFISSAIEQEKSISMMKTFEYDIRPVKGDIMDDPGFHNGYEVVKVSINYASNECFVSLHPLASEIEEIKMETYIEKLEAHSWHVVSKEELNSM
ncbi:hypothetical protein [Peribacillus simplex]|uniref:Uncharacterized protein n=1 Tax=Peribacillus simplex NBRC 15720 = DSM 1321 TaxID=1349754 RepID=A0A223EJF5_9BACI|nr:hypothetical protein [Peribacillus simplex]ASS95371.1 hypothetical protein BS1321_16485 [Peribacillus simplex NBRC 15720 = DSM 1321]MEC1399957.1 hypothetical protein [Peribacillus simplex]